MAGQTFVEKPSNSWFGAFKEKIGFAMQGLGSYLVSPFKYLAGLNKVPTDREKLREFRNDYYQRFAKEQQKPNPDYNGLTKQKSDEFKGFVNEIIAEEIKRLGPPPCKFSVIGLGSLARKECGPITDLEVGFCLEKKTIQSYQYFYQLSQRLADRLFLIGEHPDLGEKGLRLDEADNAPPYLKFFARNATPEQQQQLLQEAIQNREFDKIPFAGSRAFIGTADEFASYANPNFSQNRRALSQQKRKLVDQYIKGKKLSEKERNERYFWINQLTRPFSSREMRVAKGFGTQLGRNVAHVYGDENLYQDFRQKRERHLRRTDNNTGYNQRQSIARNKLMREDIGRHIEKGTSLFLDGKLGKTLDIKRDFYRFAEQFVTNLGFYHRTHNQNTIDVVDELVARSIIAPQFGDILKDYLQFAMGLRLKQQSVLQRQGFATYIDEEKFVKDKEDLEEKRQGLEQSIEYLKRDHGEASVIDAKSRQLFKLRQEYDHLLDMAPGKILSPEELHLLETKYAPMAKLIFDKARAWVRNPKALQEPVTMPRPPQATPVTPLQPTATVVSKRPVSPVSVTRVPHSTKSVPHKAPIKEAKQPKAKPQSCTPETIEQVYARTHSIDKMLEHAQKNLEQPELELQKVLTVIRDAERTSRATLGLKVSEAMTKVPQYNAQRVAMKCGA